MFDSFLIGAKLTASAPETRAADGGGDLSDIYKMFHFVDSGDGTRQKRKALLAGLRLLLRRKGRGDRPCAGAMITAPTSCA